MPRIEIQDPSGFSFTICTRNETLLAAWFDEVLPHLHWKVSSEVIWPTIRVFPMFAWETGMPKDPDWLQDSRVIGTMYRFKAKNGPEGMRELANLREKLEKELS